MWEISAISSECCGIASYGLIYTHLYGTVGHFPTIRGSNKIAPVSTVWFCSNQSDDDLSLPGGRNSVVRDHNRGDEQSAGTPAQAPVPCVGLWKGGRGRPQPQVTEVAEDPLQGADREQDEWSRSPPTV